MAGKRSGKSWSTAYTAYKSSDRALKNKARKLDKHRMAHPNDAQAKSVSASGHTRKASGKKGGWVTGKVFSKMAGWLRSDGTNADVPRSRAAQTMLAKHMKISASVANEAAYQKKRKQK